MNWNEDIGWERKALYRMVALLLFMADLAERAACSSLADRRRVLWALRQAEGVVSGFVAGRPRDPAVRRRPPALMTGRFDPADAIDLAVSLRALAIMVQFMAAQLPPGRLRKEAHASVGSCDGLAPRDGAIGFLRDALSAVECRDTS